MGAATAMIEAGARNNLGVKGADSFDVYVALSPQGVGAIFPRDAWANIHRPVLTLTGKRDHALAGSSWETRTEPFMGMPAGCKWLGVIDEATHMNFAGHGMSRDTERLTVKTVGTFLDQVRRQDCSSPPREPGIEIRSK